MMKFLRGVLNCRLDPEGISTGSIARHARIPTGRGARESRTSIKHPVWIGSYVDLHIGM